jgi:hypothetical protein
MPKRVTCESRDARKFCEERVSRGFNPSFGIFGENRGDPWWVLCKRIVEDTKTWDASEQEPILFSEVVLIDEGRSRPTRNVAEFWVYKNRIYKECHGNDYSLEQRILLIKEEFDKERREFEKLHAKFSSIPCDFQKRSKVPSQVRIHVWQRDSGKCVECGSNENLEYDHIIPFAKGGSNTERNLQLLCGNCNRLKSDNVQ